MFPVLTGMRVVEGASFVAGPISGQHLLELGAEVIRFDNIGGGLDYRRWPIDAKGQSLFWEGLNKGKKSVALNLSLPEGRELATRVITAPGPGSGLFVTNFPAKGFLSHEALSQLRPDMISVRIMGWPNGRNAVDYTMNAITGLPLLTGPADIATDQPVNHVLPVWDLIAGTYAAFALLAAERHRNATGQGSEIRVPLTDIAASVMGHLGMVAEVSIGAPLRPRIGNDLFGALGRDFTTADQRKLIIVAITARQWAELVKAFDLAEVVAKYEAELGVSFTEEGARFRHRGILFELFQKPISAMRYQELAQLLDQYSICWEPYKTVVEAVAATPGFVAENPMFSGCQHPSGHSYPTAGAPANFVQMPRQPATPAPQLGAHTEEVLADLLQLPEHEIYRLHDQNIVASPRREIAS